MTSMPAGVVDLWQIVGQGPFLGGYFQLCQPDDYVGVIEQIFEGDPDIQPEQTHVVGFSSFGDILAWNELHRDIRVDLVSGQVTSRYMSNPKPHVDPSISILTRILLADGPSYDMLDDDGNGLFEPATRKLGPLQLGQMFGFKSVLSLGGRPALDYIKVFPAAPHMSLLAQTTRFSLVDNSFISLSRIREIGAGA